MSNTLLNIHGIKCDNPNCDYNDPDVKVEDYKNWLNKPCPKCGENLLTEQDYNNVLFIMSLADTVGNSLSNLSGELTHKMSIQMNGTGEMDIEIKDIK